MDSLFEKGKVNQTRQTELDYIKTFLIFVMIIVHLYEDASVADVSVYPVNMFENILQFLSGPTGAPLFMFSMGMSFVFSRHKTAEDYLHRGIKIFFAGYLLNIVRDVIPNLILGLPMGYGAIPEYWEGMKYLALNIDIFMFAGLFMLVIALFRKIKVPLWWLGIIGIILQFIGVWLSNRYDFADSDLQYLFGLFFYTSEASCFPLLQWYIYPACGIIFGKYLRHVADSDRFYTVLSSISAAVIVIEVIVLNIIGDDVRDFYALKDDVFYKQNILSTIFSLACILIFIALVHFLSKIANINALQSFSSFVGPRLMQFYVVHWFFVGWFSNFIWYVLDYSIPVWATVPLAVVIYVLVYLVIKLYEKRKTAKQ